MKTDINWLEALRGETIDSAVIAVISRRVEAREALIVKLVTALETIDDGCATPYDSAGPMLADFREIIDAALAEAKKVMG